ncbi:MAG: outer membrane protein assembly factor BamD [Gammaproteobacteria bacterium]|nr:outer membrane protein assembly factor BamD [Gammaproteobacteria bacterium]
MWRSLAFLLCIAMLGGCGIIKFGAEDETAGWSAQRLYTEAKDEMGRGAYDKAIPYFEKLEARYPYGRYAQQSQLEVAYAYYRNNDPAQAIAACDRFIKLHPNHPAVDYAYYLKGVVNFYEDQSPLAQWSGQDPTERDPRSARDSFVAFRELVDRYPKSKYVPDATARMNYLVNGLAAHEVHVARYYYARGAYVAAVNRAQYTVKTYPTSPAVEEALYITAQSYEKLGMKDLQADAERVLRTNFPNMPRAQGRAHRTQCTLVEIWRPRF